MHVITCWLSRPYIKFHHDIVENSATGCIWLLLFLLLLFISVTFVGEVLPWTIFVNFFTSKSNSSLECSSQWLQYCHTLSHERHMHPDAPINTWFPHVSNFLLKNFVLVSTLIIIPLLLHSFSSFLFRRSEWEMVCAPVSLHVPFWCEILFPTHISHS